MNYWLVKSEPGTWSWVDHQKAPRKTAEWDGVRNHQAANNLKAMRRGDRAFFYHSGKERQIVGIVQVVREYYPDPTDKTERFGMVDFKAVKSVTTPVTLAAIKTNAKLADLALVRQSRLSVMPLTAAHWKIICKMGGVD